MDTAASSLNYKMRSLNPKYSHYFISVILCFQKQTIMVKGPIRFLLTIICFGLITCMANICNAQQHGYREGCYPTTWPVDMANGNRSSCITDAGFPAQPDSALIAYSSIQLPFPVFCYSRDPDEVFVMGGTPLILYNYCKAIETGSPTAPGSTYLSQFTPYLAKINPSSLNTQIVSLNGGNAINYIGGALVHANGFVYAVAAGRLFKIQSSPFQVVTAVNLPTSGLAQLNVFNGLSVSRSGRIIAKAYNQSTGQGLFLLIDESSLNVLHQIPATMASPRLTVDTHINREFIYHLNQSETYRIEVVNDSLKPDSTWTAAYNAYGDNSQSEPTSPVVAGNRVFYTTNTLYSATKPMKIFWQYKNQTYDKTMDTLQADFLHSDTLNPGWSFFHLSIDDSLSDIVVGNDQKNGTISASRVTSVGAYQQLWEKSLQTSARPAIVADRNLVYVNDYVNGFDHLVVLDLQTGQELARKKTNATKPTIGTIIVTPDDYVIYASNEAGNLSGLLNIFKHNTSTNQLPASYNGNSDLLIYPNPVGEAIQFNLNEGDYSYALFDSFGRIILHVHQPQGPQLINCSEMDNGIYLLKIYKKGTVISKKIIVQK